MDMNWIGEFAGNLADALFWPGVFTTIFAIISMIYFETKKEKSDFASQPHQFARFGQHAAVQGTIILWGLWAILAAVPAPDYITRTETVEVEKVVNRATQYDEAFDMCMENSWNNGRERLENTEICESRAEQLVLGEPRVVEREVEVQVLAPDEERYQELYNTCMGADLVDGGWGVVDTEEQSGVEARNQRIQLCHAQVKEITNQ